MHTHFSLHALVYMSVGPITEIIGCKRWFDADGKVHRDGDLPAVVWPDGVQYWIIHGELHRDDDLPAVIWPKEFKSWYQHGKLHRDGELPAEVWENGAKAWYRHGKLHRSHDLPAVVSLDGVQEWWVDGRSQSDLDRAQTRRWSALRAAFAGAVAAQTTIACARST